MSLEKLAPLFLLASAALLVANAIWGFRDGRRRGRSGVLVAMLVVWTFPVGVVLWLLFRPDVVPEREPTDCSDENLKRRANAGLL